MNRLYTRLITSKMTRLIQHLIGLIVGIPRQEAYININFQSLASIYNLVCGIIYIGCGFHL